MSHSDLREFIDTLEKSGDLHRIKEEVDWNLEAGAIMRRCNEKGERAQLFEKIKGCPEGFRILGGPVATFRRFALAMGMDANSSYSEILDEFIVRRKNPIKPMLVSDGPCKENIYKGEDVDLFKFPAPMMHDGDGGRYIGTWNAGVCKDPDSAWINYGIYRLMLQDKNSTGVFILPTQHVGIIYKKYEDMNKPMEYAAFIGAEPLAHIIATTGVPYGVSEMDIAGGLKKEPLQVIKCETVDLLVPATAEIVLEGEILPHIRKSEGPFGEYAGYQVSGKMDRPLFKVNCVTHRNDPILTASCIGTPVDDSHIATNIGWISDIKIGLLNAGIPITGIYCPPESGLHLCIVATKTPHPNIATKIAGCIWADKNGQYIPKVMVVDEDVDPTNMSQVIHAFSTKAHPKRTTIIENAFNCPIAGYLDAEEKKIGMGSNIVFDCTWPKYWKAEDIPPRASFVDVYPKKIQERVLRKWKKYGFETN